MQEGKVAGMGDAHLEACCNVSDRNERAADTIESAWTRARRSQTATALVVALAIFTDMLVYGIAVPILPDILKSMESDANQSSNKIPISPLSEHGDDASIEGSSGFPLNMDLGTAVSVLFASYAVGLLFLTPVIGIWSDRIGSRRMPMLVGLLGLAACTIVFSFAESYWLLLVARLAQGISGGVSWSIGLSMIADVYPTERLGVVMGSVLSANTLGLLLGPPIGGALYQHVGRRAPFYFSATLALIDFIGRLWIQPPSLPRRLESSSRSSSTSLVRMFLEPQVAIACLATAIISGVYSGMEPTLPLYLRDRFGLDETTIGLLFCVIVIPNMFISVIVGWVSDRYGHKLVCGLFMLSMAVASPCLGLPYSIPIEIIALMAFGLSSAGSLTPLLPDMASFVTSRGGGAYGQVYALFNVAYSFGMLGGPLMAAVLYERVGFFWEMAVYSGILVVFAPVFIFYGRLFCTSPPIEPEAEALLSPPPLEED